MRMPTAVRAGIRRYRAADAADLDDFQLRTFGPDTRQVDRARDAWLFDRNPWRTPGDERDMWVCRRGDRVIGQQGAIPFVLHVGTAEHRAAWGIDLMVDEEWRMRGPGPALLDTALAEFPIMGVMNMSLRGFALCQGLGFADLGVVPVYLRPLDLAGAAAAGTLPGPVRRAAPVAGPALRAVDAAVVAALAAGGARLERVERFDERIDEVWQAARPTTAGAVMARRDLQAVAWSIDDRPDRDRMHRYLLVQRGRPRGYVVFRMATSAERRGVVVVDYLAPPRWVAPMLVAAGVEARRRGAVAMSVKTRNEAADRFLRAAGFVRRPQGADHPIRFMVHCDDSRLRPVLTDRRRWFVTSADCDLEYGMTPVDETDTTGTAGTLP